MWFATMGCAEPKPAEAPKPAAVDVIAPTKEEPVAAPTAAVVDTDRPAGDLVCRTEKPNGSSMELFVKWDAEDSRGTIRETAVTGLVHLRRVRAERDGKLVIADDLGQRDLAVHAAVVAERDGKKVMKVDDNFFPCR